MPCRALTGCVDPHRDTVDSDTAPAALGRP